MSFSQTLPVDLRASNARRWGALCLFGRTPLCIPSLSLPVLCPRAPLTVYLCNVDTSPRRWLLLYHKLSSALFKQAPEIADKVHAREQTSCVGGDVAHFSTGPRRAARLVFDPNFSFNDLVVLYLPRLQTALSHAGRAEPFSHLLARV